MMDLVDIRDETSFEKEFMLRLSGYYPVEKCQRWDVGVLSPYLKEKGISMQFAWIELKKDDPKGQFELLLDEPGGREHSDKFATRSPNHAIAVVEIDAESKPTRFYLLPCNKTELTPSKRGHKNPYYSPPSGFKARAIGQFIKIVINWLKDVEKTVIKTIQNIKANPKGNSSR
jgi:hypothetical protein